MLNRNYKVRKYNQTSAADLLQDVMAAHQITQQNLADHLGVSQKNISDILNHKRFLDEVMALRIEKVLGISSQMLLQLDLNYRLQRAKTSGAVTRCAHPSDVFLKKYQLD